MKIALDSRYNNLYADKARLDCIISGMGCASSSGSDGSRGSARTHEETLNHQTRTGVIKKIKIARTEAVKIVDAVLSVTATRRRRDLRHLQRSVR